MHVLIELVIFKMAAILNMRNIFIILIILKITCYFYVKFHVSMLKIQFLMIF